MNIADKNQDSSPIKISTGSGVFSSTKNLKIAAALAVVVTCGFYNSAQAQQAQEVSINITTPSSAGLVDDADGEAVSGNFTTSRNKTIGVSNDIVSGYSITAPGSNNLQQNHNLTLFQTPADSTGSTLKGITVDDNARQDLLYDLSQIPGLASEPKYAAALASSAQALTANVTNNGSVFVFADTADGFYSRGANTVFSNNGAVYAVGGGAYAARVENSYNGATQQKGRSDINNGPYTYSANQAATSGILFSNSLTKGAAVAYNRAGGVVTNDGVILGTGLSYGIQAEAENLENGTVSINNRENGIIMSTGNTAIMLGYAGPTGDMIGDSTKAKSQVDVINNSGYISGSVNAIEMGDSGSLTDITINNSGVISGNVKLTRDADFASTFNNSNDATVRGDITLSRNYTLNMNSGDLYGSLKVASEGGVVNLVAARIFGDIENSNATSGGDLNWSTTQKFTDSEINTARVLITGVERFSDAQIDGYGASLVRDYGYGQAEADAEVASLKTKNSAATQEIDKTTRAEILMYSDASSLKNKIDSYIGGNVTNTKNFNLSKGDSLVGGNVTLNSDGRLSTKVGNDGNGRLIALGDVVVEKGANIFLEYDAGYLAPDNSTFTIIDGGSLTVLDTSNNQDLSSDPSAVSSAVKVTSSDQYASFNAFKNGNLLKVTNGTVSSSTALDNYLTSSGISNVSEIEKLSGGGLLDQNNAQLFTPFIEALGTLRTTNYAMFKSINDEMISKTGKDYATLISQFAPNQSMMSGLSAGLQSSNQSITSVISQQLTAQTVTDGNNFAVFKDGTNPESSENGVASSNRVRNGLAAGNEVGDGMSLWLQPVASRVDQDAKDGITGFITNSYGAVLGADTLVAEHMRLGVALSYNKVDVDAKGNGDSLFASGNNHNRNDMHADAYGVALFSSYHPGDYFFETQASFTHSDVVSERYVSASEATARGEFASRQYGLEAKVGRNFEYNGTIVAPSVSAQYTMLDQDSYTETGLSSLSLHVENDSPQYFNTGAGVRVAHEFALEDGSSLLPELRTQYLYTLGDTQTQTRASFVGNGQVFTSKSAAIDHHGLRFGGGLTYNKNNYHIYADTNYTWRETSQGIEGALKLKLDF